jgi:hypothetical protein
MAATDTTTIVTGVDLAAVPAKDLERAAAFYGEALGLRRSTWRASPTRTATRSCSTAATRRARRRRDGRYATARSASSNSFRRRRSAAIRRRSFACSAP